uniref:Uncharacterized protein n=1 Tax=Ailuropoda melanoleuca TaxID=9646 RepID=A0A7N5JIV4_AILME
MYYKFSGFTQRLVGAGASAACSPQGFKPAVSVESPAVIFDTPIKVTPDTPNKVGGLVKSKVPELQRLFQKPDDLPTCTQPSAVILHSYDSILYILGFHVELKTNNRVK